MVYGNEYLKKSVIEYLMGSINDMLVHTVEQTKLVVDSTSRVLERPDLFDPVREREIMIGELNETIERFQSARRSMRYYLQHA